MQRLLIAAILLLVRSNIAAILSSQGNPLLERLEFHVPLFCQGGVNGGRWYSCWHAGYAVASSCAARSKQHNQS